MSRRLAVCVTTREGGPHALAPAAVRAGVEVEIILTGEGVHLTRDSGFPELLRWARVEASVSCSNGTRSRCSF